MAVRETNIGRGGRTTLTDEWPSDYEALLLFVSKSLPQ